MVAPYNAESGSSGRLLFSVHYFLQSKKIIVASPIAAPFTANQAAISHVAFDGIARTLLVSSVILPHEIRSVLPGSAKDAAPKDLK